MSDYLIPVRMMMIFLKKSNKDNKWRNWNSRTLLVGKKNGTAMMENSKDADSGLPGSSLKLQVPVVSTSFFQGKESISLLTPGINFFPHGYT